MFYLLLLLLPFFFLLLIIIIFIFESMHLKTQTNFSTAQIKLLNRIATLKDDGTVEFEVPGDVEAEALGGRSRHVHNVVDEDPLDAADLQYIPPLQIVMLIVGTRGDVQPFIAIGKRLQV